MKRFFRLLTCLTALLPAIACHAQLYPVPPAPNPFSYGYTFNQYYWYNDDEAYKMNKLAKQAALDSAKANIKLLKQNTLVVRLRTGASKIKALNRQINSPNVNDKLRKRYQSMLDKARAEIRAENLILMDAFKEHYTFSNVVFMPDTMSLNLKKGAKKGIFLNEKLEIDTTIFFQGHFFLAYYGESDYDDNSTLEGLNIFDERFEPLKYPFPSFIERAYIWRFLRTLFFKAPTSEHYEKLVEKFNKTMEIN